MQYEDVKQIKKDLEENTKHGFGYFLKNIGMIILIFLGVFIITNPVFITNPTKFIEGLTINSLYTILVLFMIIAGFYQLAKSVQRDNINMTKEQRIVEYEEAMKRKDEEDKKQHANLVQKRFEIGPLIANELKNLLIRLDADRAAIMEFHNGTYNASGLPFVYGDMVYEEVSPNVIYASDEFKNFNLSKLPFVALHYNEKTWIGSVDEVEKDDPYFAAKLRVVQVNFGAFVILEGMSGPLGFLTLFFKDDKKHPSKAKVMAEVTHSAQILSVLLDKIKD